MPRSGGTDGSVAAKGGAAVWTSPPIVFGASRSAEARRGTPQLPAALGEPVRRTGKQQWAQLLVDGVHPEPALVEMVRHEQLGGLVDRTDRPSSRLRRDGDLLARPFEQPGIEDAVEDLLRLGPHERVRTRERGAELVAPEHGQHLAELLGRHHHRHEAVGAGEDAERQQACRCSWASTGTSRRGSGTPSRDSARPGTGRSRGPRRPSSRRARRRRWREHGGLLRVRRARPCDRPRSRRATSAT